MMPLPSGLITNRTASLPGDLKKHTKAIGRVRHERGIMNKREKRYAAYLSQLKREGTILDYWFERVTLLLADKPEGTNMKGTRYTPDFMVQVADGSIEFHEVKGFAEDDAIVKFKVAAEQYPFAFRWIDGKK